MQLKNKPQKDLSIDISYAKLAQKFIRLIENSPKVKQVYGLNFILKTLIYLKIFVLVKIIKSFSINVNQGT